MLVASVVGTAVLVFGLSQAWVAARAHERIVTRRGTIVVRQDDQALRFLLSDDSSFMARRE